MMMDGEDRSFLERSLVRDVVPHRKLISLKSTDSIQFSLQTLADNAITGAPVFDANSNAFLGFVDVLDLAMFIATVFADNFKKHPHLYDPKELGQRFSLSVMEVINASKRDPFLPVDIDSSLAFIINNFLRYGIHRVAIRQGDTIVGLASQSDVVRYLAKHPQHFGSQRKLTLTELGLARGNVVAISNTETLIKAFNTMLTHKISGLAITDVTSGKLVNNLSASDLKGVTQESFWKLEIPIHQMLANMGTKLPPIALPESAALGEAMDLFQKTGVHRIFVVDHDFKPVNVISLTDVLNIFVTPLVVTSK